MIAFQILLDFKFSHDHVALFNTCMTDCVRFADCFLSGDGSFGEPDFMIFEFSDGSALTTGISVNLFRFTSTFQGAFDALDNDYFPDGSFSALD